ncbi:UNVERIFIED_CONTAM: hypothetical protein HDU68_011225 [Siphonaria sp. JEL0065]|nr:hypothetical protein HDU68_011225 [Siphonaria sp. JEL0065]
MIRSFIRISTRRRLSTQSKGLVLETDGARVVRQVPPLVPSHLVADRLLNRPQPPLITKEDVYDVAKRQRLPLSKEGYALSQTQSVNLPLNQENAPSTSTSSDASSDAFDKTASIAQINPPNWNAFNAAVAEKDALAAWLSFKDILFSDVEKKKVSSVHINHVLYLLSRCKPYPKIKLMLETLGYADQLALPPNIDSQNLLLEAHSRIGDIDNAKKVAISFGEMGLVPNLKTYNLFLDLHVKEGNLAACIAFYERMIDEGIEPDVHSFNSLIHGCLKLNKVNRVDSYFQEMIGLGIDPDQKTINLVIQHISKNTKDAQSVIKKLESFQETYVRDPSLPAQEEDSSKVEPNAAIYTALIKAYAAHGRIDLSRACFSNAKQLPDADAHLYTAMLHVLVEHPAAHSSVASTTSASNETSFDESDNESTGIDSQHQEPLEIFAEMMSKPNIQVDSIAFATLVQMFVKARDLDRAEQIVNVGMKARGIPVTFAVWSALLEGYVDSGRIGDAVRLFEQMRMEGSYPPTYLYNLVLRGLASDFDMELLERHWGRWLWSLEVEDAEIARIKTQKKGGQAGRKAMHGLRKLARPDAESYSIVVDAFVACQDIDRAMKEVSKMISGKFVPPAKTFVSLIEAHVRRRDYKAAAETMLMMRTAISDKEGAVGLQQIIKANAGHFEGLVKGLLAKSEALEKASITDIPASATPHDLARLKVFAANSGQMAADMNAKRVLGVELYKEMIASDCVPTEETFQCVIRAHNRAGDLVSAIKAWMSFRSLHVTIVPQTETVNVLLQCVKDLGKMASARAVVDMVKKENLVLDAQGHGLYLYLLARWGWKDELISSVVDMVNAGVQVTNPVVGQIEQGLKLYKNVDAAAKEREVLGFLEENWPEALSCEEEFVPVAAISETPRN